MFSGAGPNVASATKEWGRLLGKEPDFAGPQLPIWEMAQQYHLALEDVVSEHR